MTNTVLLKRSATPGSAPSAGNLSPGELAINYADGTLYYKNNSSVVTVIASNQYVSVSGNVTAANVFVTNVVSAAGNVIGGNVLTAGLISAAANVTGGNILTAGLISATGNITAGSGNFFIGNGSQLTGVLATGVGTLASLSVTGNIDTGNLRTAGVVTAQGNITGGNILTEGSISAASTVYSGTEISAAGNVTGGNVNSNALISAVGNLVGGNVVTAGLISATSTITSAANITGGNLLTGGLISAGTNIMSSGLITATGNVTGGNVTSLGVLNVSGTGQSSINGNLTMNSKYIVNLADPVNPQDAATKYYVDSIAEGLHIHESCWVATTSNLAVATGGTITYNNGVSGVGATLTTTGTYLLIDSVNVQSAGRRILVKNEANAAHNGIYTYSNTTAITRATDFDTATEIASGDFTFISYGSSYANTGWVQTNAVTTIGTDPIEWTQFSGAGTYQAGTGLTLANNVFSVNASQTQITEVGNLTSLSVVGNIDAGNVRTAGLISATGNVTGNYFIGNGSQLTGLNFSLSGNLAGNLLGNGFGAIDFAFVSSTGNVAAGGITTNGSLSVAGNVIGGTVSTVGSISATGNITGGNILGGANVNATTHTGTTVSVSGNIDGGNLLTAGQVSATGNVTGNYFIGNGSQLSGISTVISNDNSSNVTLYPAMANITSGSLSTAFVSNSKLTFNPSTGDLSATNFNSLSDERTKTEIQTIVAAVELLMNLRGVYFRWKDNGKKSMGLIAQEVEKYVPEVITTAENGIKSVSYGSLIGLLVEVIKNHETRLQKLEKTLNF